MNRKLRLATLVVTGGSPAMADGARPIAATETASKSVVERREWRSAQLGYEPETHWSTRLAVKDLLDDTCYEKVSFAGRQNLHRQPGSFPLALRATC